MKSDLYPSRTRSIGCSQYLTRPMDWVKTMYALAALFLMSAGIAWAQAVPLYHLTFGASQLTNSGSVGGSATVSVPSAGGSVQIAEDATLGRGGFAAAFLMNSTSYYGPFLTLPSGTSNLQLTGSNDAITVSAWIKWNGPDSHPDERQVVAGNFWGSAGWVFSVSNTGLLKFNYWTAAGGASGRNSTVAIPQGTWTHVAMVWRNDNSYGLSFYINGAPVGIDVPYTGYGPLKASGYPVVIGASGWNTMGINGSLADIRLYDRALDQAGVTQVCQTKATGARYVFAHYMVCNATAASSGTSVQDFMGEIQRAQARGIDGFALNCGAWISGTNDYKAKCNSIYEAARQLNTGFKLFISADHVQNSDLVDMVESYRSHPNQLTYNGKPVLSTFGGDAASITPFITSQFGASPCPNSPIFFAPYYYAYTTQGYAHELPTLAESQQLYANNPSLNGFFYFGAAGTPSALTTCVQDISSVWHGANKVFMAPVTPYYRGIGGNYRVFETNGYQGWIQEWQAAIQGADWVEIVTWNDWGESSYIAPFASPSATEGPWSFNYGSYYSHAGYLDLAQYYIRWFKLGYPPAIDRDAVYYSYRLHPSTLKGHPYPATSGSLALVSGAASLSDQIHATVMLTGSAQLSIIVGGTLQQQFSLPVGVNSVSVPMVAGQPRFILERDGQTVIDQWGEQTISATDSSGNYQYFASSSDAASHAVPKPHPGFEFTFDGGLTTNTGYIGSTAQKYSLNNSSAVQIALDSTLGAGLYSAAFPMNTGGLTGPVLNLPGGAKFPLTGLCDSLTISTWLKWNGVNAGSDGRQVIAANMPTTLNAGWAFSVNAQGCLRLDYATATGTNSRTSTVAIPQGEWTHVAVTWKNAYSTNGLEFYINGEPARINLATTGGGPLTSTGLSLAVGAVRSSCVLPLNGTLALFRIYGFALDPESIVDSADY